MVPTLVWSPEDVVDLTHQGFVVHQPDGVVTWHRSAHQPELADQCVACLHERIRELTERLAGANTHLDALCENGH